MSCFASPKSASLAVTEADRLARGNDAYIPIRAMLKKFGVKVYAVTQPMINDTEEGEMRVANLKELVTIASRYDALRPLAGVEKLLEDAALMSEQDNFSDKKESVSLMTTHAAKGLEFDYVFVSGLEDGLFPHARAGAEGDEGQMEEERRLFYVALTRARKNIFLSYTFFRTIFGEKRVNEPSRFLFDIPKELFKNIKDGGAEVIQYS